MQGLTGNYFTCQLCFSLSGSGMILMVLLQLINGQKFQVPLLVFITNAASAILLLRDLFRVFIVWTESYRQHSATAIIDVMQVTVNPALIFLLPLMQELTRITARLWIQLAFGNGTDPDGSVVAGLWTKISGANCWHNHECCLLLQPCNRDMGALSEFELWVTGDNNGAFWKRHRTGNCKYTSGGKNAGNDISITLPVNTVSFQNRNRCGW